MKKSLDHLTYSFASCEPCDFWLVEERVVTKNANKRKDEVILKTKLMKIWFDKSCIYVILIVLKNLVRGEKGIIIFSLPISTHPRI